MKNKLLRIFLSCTLLPVMKLTCAEGIVKTALFIAAYLIVGFETLKEAAEGIIGREPFDECFLMAVATLGAAALGDFTESVAVMIFFCLGEMFEDIAVDKSRNSITALMDIRPDTAVLLGDNGETETVSPEKVGIGRLILVRPGEKIPIDGVIVEGESSLNTAALTGESLPTEVMPGSEVQSGCINLSGVLRIRTTKLFGESAASKILELMENAAESKAKSESFITKFARVYTPAVCASALVLALLPPVIRLLSGNSAEWGTWVYRALTFLVISCPCALVISIPLTFFAGLGGAGREGILIKGSNFMETLSKVKTVVLDKTGTLTKGVFEITEIQPVGMGRDELLEYAALCEGFSNHPIAEGIRHAYGKPCDGSRVTDLREIGGQGICAEVDGTDIAVGNHRLMELLNIEYEVCEKTGTLVYVAVGGKYCGYLLISDMIRPEAKEAVALLRKSGVEKLIMLTGDNEKSASYAAEALSIDMFYAKLLPSDKVGRVEELLSEDGKLAFAGDGINDAPVIKRADVGIAMGAIGSDAAIESADVVLMDDDPRKIARAINISRRTLRIVYENIIFAVGVKLACLVLGAFGVAGMWMAIFADVGVMVIAVLNAMRALGQRS